MYLSILEMQVSLIQKGFRTLKEHYQFPNVLLLCLYLFLDFELVIIL